MIKLAFAAITALATCAASVSALASEPIQTKSDIKHASVVALSALPHSPEDGAIDSYCEGYREKTLTDAGREVAKAGWIVTSEGHLGAYAVVTFASGFDPGTSGLCFPRNTNIGFFKDGALVALVYAAESSDVNFGLLEPLENGALLVWPGERVGIPVGELHIENGGLRLTHTAPERTFCHFKAVVPNIYGKPLNVARTMLIAHGWKPVRPRERPGELDAARTLEKRGVIEAESCSGTGVGYCGFSYRSAAGTLGVTTVGGDPDPAGNTVQSYGVACSGAQPKGIGRG